MAPPWPLLCPFLHPLATADLSPGARFPLPQFYVGPSKKQHQAYHTCCSSVSKYRVDTPSSFLFFCARMTFVLWFLCLLFLWVFASPGSHPRCPLFFFLTCRCVLRVNLTMILLVPAPRLLFSVFWRPMPDGQRITQHVTRVFHNDGLRVFTFSKFVNCIVFIIHRTSISILIRLPTVNTAPNSCPPFIARPHISKN